MIRKQVYLDSRHDKQLKRQARERGVTEAEIIREALDTAAPGGMSRTRTVDPEAGRELLASLRALARRGRGRARRSLRSWTRESLYEDRTGRWTKS